MRRGMVIGLFALGLLSACAPTTTGAPKPQINMNHEEWLGIHMKPLEELDVDYLLSQDGLKCHFPQPIWDVELERAAKKKEEIKGALATIKQAEEELAKLDRFDRKRDFMDMLLRHYGGGPRPRIKVEEVRRMRIRENGRAAQFLAVVNDSGEVKARAYYLRYTPLSAGWMPCLVVYDTVRVSDMETHVGVAYWLKEMAKVASFWNRPLEEVLRDYLRR